MAEESNVRQYRIGDYAQKMGVTPDLLKHYEKMGLIHARTTESGYRYYPFPESVPLLECMALRNYRVPLQQMRELLYEGSLTAYQTALAEKAEAIRRNMLLEQAVLDEYAAQVRWMERMTGRETYMLMEEREDTYFLPHSKRHDFLNDDRIQDLLPRWAEWMPMVKSARKISLKPDGDSLTDAVWGLSVPVSQAEAFGLPLNGVVERLPGGRHMILHYRAVRTQNQSANRLWGQVQSQVRQHGMNLNGPILQTVFVSLFSPDHATSCGMFSIPMMD